MTRRAARIELAVPSNDPRLSRLSSALFAQEARVLELSEATTLLVSFPSELSAAELEARVRAALEGVAVPVRSFDLKAEASADWSSPWRRHFEPARFGPLWVIPAWSSAPEGATQVLRIDPGMAFGTGTHATSAMCLEWLVTRCATTVPSRVLDVGIGSGLLALAALILGVSEATGVDTEEDALWVASRNASLNACAARLTLGRVDPERAYERFPTVLANVLTEPLIADARRLASAVDPGGDLILSGVREGEVDRILAVYLPLGFTRVGVALRDGWARVDLLRA